MTRPMDELNALEQLEAEETAGLSILRLADPAQPKLKLLGALAWVHRKRTEPALKFRDYMASTDIGGITDYLYTDPDEPEEVEGNPFPEGEAEPDPGGLDEAEGPVLYEDGDSAG